MALKFETAASERQHMAEKTGSDEVKKIAAMLDQNEKALLEANRAKSEATLAVEQLYIQNRELNKTIRDAYHQARAAGASDHKSKHKGQSEKPKKP
jgi:hypothetical protein